MPKPSNTLRFAAGVAVTAIVAGVLVYAGMQRGGAHVSPAAELLSALPAGAPTLVYLDLASLRASGFYQHRPEHDPIAVPSQDYAEFVKSTGFDFEKDLDRVAFASWPASAGKERPQKVLIAEGRFDRPKIRDYATHQGKVDHQQGREVLLFPTDDRKAWNSVSFLNDHRIAIVAGPSIAPLFGRDVDPASDPVRLRAARLDGVVAFAITRVPEVPDNLAPAGAQSTQLASLARSLQWITLAARPEGEDLRISLEGECDNGENARQLQSALEVLRMFGRTALGNPKTKRSIDPATYSVLQALLSSADVTQSGERVRVLLELTPDILKLGEKRNP